MPFTPLPQRAWKDLLGPNYLGMARNNVMALRGFAQLEHRVDTGEHNAWEVPRIAVAVGTGAVTPGTSDVTSVTNPATGTFVLTLAGARFSTGMRVQITPIREDVKPYLATYKVASATSLEIYNKKLSSTLGVAGNSWAAVNDGVYLTIHSTPLANAAWATTGPDAFSRGEGLVGGGAGLNSWSKYVRAQGELNKVLLVGHTAAGEHAVRTVAPVAGRVLYDSSTPKYISTEQTGISSLTRTGAGVVEVTYSALSNATPIVSADFARFSGGSSAALFIAVAKVSSSTKTIVYIYGWDAVNGWWAAADCDFFIAVHG